MKVLTLSIFVAIAACCSGLPNNSSTNITVSPFSATSTVISSTVVQTTQISSKPPSTASTTSAPTTKILCSQRNASCGECVKDIRCFWCGSDNTCREYPRSKIIPRDCKKNNWYWKQCFAAGHILVYVVPSVCFAVLLILGCCIYCLCCRNRRRRGYEREDKKFERRQEEACRRNADRRAQRRLKTDAMRQKYGLLQSDDDAEVA